MAIILPILSTFNASGVKAAQSSLGGLGGALGKIGAQVTVAAVAFKALQGAVNFANESISQARDLQRNLASLDTVFGDLSGRMTTFTANAYKMGISQSDAARTATFLGSVLKQAGFGMDDVAGQTEKLTVLAQDLATTYGYDTSEALTAMTALFRGEYDPIEKFGVALKQNEVNSLLAAKGMSNLTGQALLNAQQQIRLEQLYKRSADAQGAFAAQSGTLFVEQKKLNAVFDNMQATVGQQLTPAIASLMAQMTPVIESLGPRLAETFGHVADALINLSPIIEPLSHLLNSVIDIFNILLTILDPLIRSLGIGLAVALDFLVDLTDSLGRGIDDLVGYFNDLAEAVQFTKDAPVTSWLEDQMRVLAEYIPSLAMLVGLVDAVKGKVTEVTAKSNITSSSRLRGQRADRQSIVAVVPSTTTGTTTGASKPKNVIADYYAQLADEVAKQSAKLRLTNLGASEALISSIIGSGDQWMKMFTKVNNSGKKGVAELQKTFNKTATGLSEIKAAQEVAAKAFKDLYDAAVERNKTLEDSYRAQVVTLNDYKKSLSDIVSSLKPLAVADRIIGEFEQSAVDSFTNIADSITQGLADGTLTADAAKTLSDYANKEKDVFVTIGKQRDALFEKRSLAKALIDDVKSAISGFGNINSLISQQTNQVTTTVEKMIDGFKVTTSRTIDEAVNAGDMVSSFQKIVERTKAFAAQLKELRALGLDKNLYKQIVDAGVDAGTVTAAEIIKGGTGTVNELNNLFGELNTVGASIAEETAQVMYGAGVDVSNGLIAGLLAEEQQLVSTAETLANAFINAFNASMAAFTVQIPNYEALPVQVVNDVMTKIDPEKIFADKLTNLRSRLDSLGTISGAAEQATASSLMSQIRSTASDWSAMNPSATTGVSNTTVVNLTVKASAGVDTKKTGQDIVAIVNKYATSSGGGSVNRFI